MESHELLFPEPETTRTGPLGWVEPSVHWFTQSTLDLAVASRSNVNRWYADFPDTDARLATRLRSEVDKDHYQALDELFVHQLLLRRWTDIRYEERGTGPDFRLYDPDANYAGGVEVVSLFEREDWDETQRIHGRLADSVNMRIRPTAGYFVHFQIDKADREPTPRKFIAYLERELRNLPPPERLQVPIAPTLDDLPGGMYREEGIEIRVGFVPMRLEPAFRNDPDARIVGTGPMTGGMVNTAARIRDRVNSKAGARYDVDSAPFLVVVGLHSVFETDYEVVTALYGSEAVEIPSGRMTRQNDGLFGVDTRHPRGRHRRVSAVAVLRKVHAWDPEGVDVSLLWNPFAYQPWPHRFMAATRWFGEIGRDEGRAQFGWLDEPPTA